ncbi:MAG: hypothetical protein E7Z65_06255 [Thermoplasmata archaeon]|nr:hypothetical protein [Thermoplasmata archaeon]
MKRQCTVRTVPAPHSPQNVPKSCWTCLHRGPVTADWCYCNKGGRGERRKNTDPCEDYGLDAIWLITDWLYV